MIDSAQRELSMRDGKHTYAVSIRWTGNRGSGTRDYTSYDRTHEITAPSKPAIAGSSDAAFRGDATRYNPEDLLVASLSACHMLSYLHLCAVSGIEVVAYADDAAGTMVEVRESGGHFTDVVLRPRVTIANGDPDLAAHLHEKAHHQCFIANSVNFPVRCEPTITLAPG
jgi:organic hydroperoxide reductase OsmC/OhrA